MSTPYIRRQLEGHLVEWLANNSPFSYAPGYFGEIYTVDISVVAWQNVAFTPPSGVWLQATLLPADTVSGSLAATEWKGAFRINVFGDAGVGPGAVEAVAESIAGFFRSGTDLNGVRVPRPPTVGRGDSDDAMFMVPVSIRYRFEAK